jgi:HlyD family secretion protein
MKKKNRKKVVILILIVVVIGCVVFFNLSREKETPINVTTDKVKSDRIVQTVNASGSLVPVTQVKISANVSAKIMDIHVDEGDTVKKGDLLVELDKAQYEASYERALSVLQSNQANRRKVASDYKRIKELYDKNLTSEAELEAASAQLELAESQVVQAESAVKQALDDLEKTKLSSPVNGIVTDIRKEVGEIALGSVFQEDVILVISDLSKMEVTVDVDETDVVNINLGDTTFIEIDALPDTVFKGIVSKIAHSATTTGYGTQEQVTNFKVEIAVLGQDKRFRPGMSSTVDIITDVRDSTLVIPIQALTIRSIEDDSSKNKQSGKALTYEGLNSFSKGNEKEVVFVVKYPENSDKDTKYSYAEMRPVKVGISSDTHFEIIEGLEKGEEIVVGSYKAISKELKDGSPLKITNKG